jgi:nitrogen regulatory protein P-II 1
VKLVVIILNRVEYLEDLLAAFLEIGISGATVLNSVGMGQIISKNIPIFAGLSDAFPGSSPSNRTILAVVKERQVKRMARMVEEVCGSLDDPGTGLLVSLSLDEVFGFRPFTE